MFNVHGDLGFHRPGLKFHLCSLMVWLCLISEWSSQGSSFAMKCHLSHKIDKTYMRCVENDSHIKTTQWMRTFVSNMP